MILAIFTFGIFSIYTYIPPMKQNLKQANSEIRDLKKRLKKRKEKIFEKYEIDNFTKDMTSKEFFEFRSDYFPVSESRTHMENWYNTCFKSFTGKPIGKIFIKHFFTQVFETAVEKEMKKPFPEYKGVTQFIDSITINIESCYFEENSDQKNSEKKLIFGKKSDEKVTVGIKPNEAEGENEGKTILRLSEQPITDNMYDFRLKESVKIRIFIKNTNTHIFDKIISKDSKHYEMASKICDMFMLPEDCLDFSIELRDNSKKFVAAREKRLKNFKIALKQIGRLSNKRYYEYNNNDIEELKKTIEDYVIQEMKKFESKNNDSLEIVFQDKEEELPF